MINPVDGVVEAWISAMNIVNVFAVCKCLNGFSLNGECRVCIVYFVCCMYDVYIILKYEFSLSTQKSITL